MRLATGPVTWGVDFADAPGNPPWRTFLDEVASSPLDALELGPIGYLPEDSRTLREELGRRRLRAVGSFVFDDFHDPGRLEDVLAASERAVRAIAAAAGSVLVIIDRPSPARAGTAGRSDAAERLRGTAWRRMVTTVERAAALARDAGLRPAFHPHAGTYVEFGDEIERLLAETDVDLCFDSGHLAYAGLDPVAAAADYSERIGHVHLKDVGGEVLRRLRDDRVDFWTAIAAGVFCPLGEGAVDFAAVLAALDEAGYEEYMTIEQDRLPGRGSPLDDLAASVEYLREALELGRSEEKGG